MINFFVSARQHLMWMLEKDGHGRSVRFGHINHSVYRKHNGLLKALNDALSIEDLRCISSCCLTGVYRTGNFLAGEEMMLKNKIVL